MGYEYDAEDIVEEVDIVEYISQYVDLQRKGTEYFGLCPFHSDINPSFSVTPESKCWYCFGCHKGGSVIEFAREINHWWYSEAISNLAKYANLDINTTHQPRHLSVTKVMKSFAPPQSKEKAATYQIMRDDVMMQYQKCGKEADIWRNEGISDAIMTKYQVRYDPMSQRLVFPIRNPQGKIINISGRTLDPEWKTKKLRKYNYYTSLGRLDTLYGLSENLDEIKRKREIIIFEGAKSVFKADQWGFGNAVAALTSRINPYQLQILVKLGCRVVFAFDEEVNVRGIDTIKTLRHFVPVEIVVNHGKVLAEKMSPVDVTKEVWEFLYNNRVRF